MTAASDSIVEMARAGCSDAEIAEAAHVFAQLRPCRALLCRYSSAEAREARAEAGTATVSQEGAPVTRALYAAYTAATLAIAVGGWLA